MIRNPQKSLSRKILLTNGFFGSFGIVRVKVLVFNLYKKRKISIQKCPKYRQQTNFSNLSIVKQKIALELSICTPLTSKFPSENLLSVLNIIKFNMQFWKLNLFTKMPISNNCLLLQINRHFTQFLLFVLLFNGEAASMEP